jgi:hypothetical protein
MDVFTVNISSVGDEGGAIGALDVTVFEATEFPPWIRSQSCDRRYK